MSTLSAARALLAAALAIPEASLPATARIGGLEQWDSLAHARILLALEDKLGRLLEAETAARIESLDDIARVLAESHA